MKESVTHGNRMGTLSFTLETMKDLRVISVGKVRRYAGKAKAQIVT
jgi:hypothetical protein